MADVIYNSFKQAIMNGSVDLDTDTIRVALVTSAYSPNQDDDDFWGEVSANEVSGTGYTAGGETLSAGQTVSVDDTDNEGVFDANDITWSSSTINAWGAVIYQDQGAASADQLICYIDFTEEKSSDSGNFTITWNSEGILNLN